MAQNITLLGASYSAVPAVTLPKTGGGTARFDDASVTTATASDVANGKVFLASNGTITTGTASGGNDFIVTLTWDDDYFEEGVGAWVPDHTLLEIRTAYSAGKNIITTNENAIDALSDGVYIYDEIGGEPADYYIYAVTWYDGELGITYSQSGHLDSESLDIGEPYIISPNLESREVTYTPSNQAQENWLYPESPYNGFSSVGVTVNAVPNADWDGVGSAEFITQNNQRKWRYTPKVTVFDGGWISQGTHNLYTTNYNAVPSGTTITPTTSAQTIGGNNYMMEGAVTVSAMPSGTAGTPTASKGAVNNHSIAVTPSVTNTTGYITGSTKTGTAVTVSASELVSGSQTLSDNGDYDVTNLASVTVNVSGGGGSSMTIGTKTTTLNAASSTITFSGLSGNPLAFAVTSSADQSTGSTRVVSLAYDGTSIHGMDITTQAENDTGFTKTYSSGTLTITATTATFGANAYKLVYAYGGSSSDIHTEDVQVGSGATSITFSGLSGRPLYFSCVFKSTFSTSSGYQRVMDVVNDGTNTYGNALDSSAKALTSWSYTYSGGSLTITSSGTNNGGYFHQPGYYQLTYAVDPNAISLQNKTNVSATTSSQTITADVGYDGLESVQINAISQTNLTAANIKSGTTISVNNGSTNLWSVTGTYDGGGGDSNVQIYSGRDEVNATSYTATDVTLTVSKAGTYKCYWSMDRNTTSGTSGSQLYKNGSAVGSAHTTWTHNGASCEETLTFAKNDVLVVRARARSTSYYTGVSNLVIIEQ